MRGAPEVDRLVTVEADGVEKLCGWTRGGIDGRGNRISV